jgi:hypothetical protein
MRRALRVSFVAALAAVPLALVASDAGSSVASTAQVPGTPYNPTVKIAGLQHSCAWNGILCADPATSWDELRGYQAAVKAGARIFPYIGHDEPTVQFYSNQPGSGNDVTYRIKLPKDPPTRPVQDGSGGAFGFQLHPTFWLGMVLCDPNGSPNPDGAALSGHATVPCTPDSNSNIFASENPGDSHYFGLGPGQAFEEMQFYPPGWVPQPTGIGCTAKQWCAALTIDTFADNQNTGQLNNTACLNAVGPEPVNFAFITKNGVATAPGNPGDANRFVPVLSRDMLMNSGDNLTVHLFDTPDGLKVTIKDHTTHATGSMTASSANGFGTVVFDPNAKNCTITPFNFHPEYSTSTPQTRDFNAAHTSNISFSDEIGHFEYCAQVANDPIGSCLKPLGPDTNNPDVALDPKGDDVFCLPASASLDVRIGGCLNTDGDFDSVPYTDSWPGSISNPLADRLLHPTSELFSSPTTVGGANFTSMAFESNISRSESADTEFRAAVPCQRHFLNPMDPSPGTGCVNPPPGAIFYPFFSTRNTGDGCMWQEGGPYIPGTTNDFGGSAAAEFGALTVIHYPTAPFGLVTERSNDFRSGIIPVACLST